MVGGIVVGLAAAGLGFAVAAPAGAGCEPRPMAVTYCDGPWVVAQVFLQFADVYDRPVGWHLQPGWRELLQRAWPWW